MPLAPKSMQELEQPDVRLRSLPPSGSSCERLLVHPLFANSKRYPALLAYVSRADAAGQRRRAERTQHRHRSLRPLAQLRRQRRPGRPHHRRRSAQAPLAVLLRLLARRASWSIELPIGSYVPVFARPSRSRRQPAVERCFERLTRPTQPRHRLRPSAPAAPCPALAIPLARLPVASGSSQVAAVSGVCRVAHPSGCRPGPPPSNIDRFWEPFTSSANPTTFCLGEPAKNIDIDSINSFEAPVSPPQPEKLYFRLHYSGNLALADVITLTRTAAALETRHKTFRVVPASEATFRPAARRAHRADWRVRQYLDAARDAETALRLRVEGWRRPACRPQEPDSRQHGPPRGICPMRSSPATTPLLRASTTAPPASR